MTKVILIEDEPAALNYLIEILTSTYRGKLQILGTSDTVEGGIALIIDTKPDLVFLDIELKDGIGFEILNHFSENVNFEVIFTSGHIDYKEKAMDYFAFYFLSKPIQMEKFTRVIDRYLLKKTAFDFEKYLIFKNQLESERKTIALPSSNGNYIIIDLEELMYCEADGSYTNYYTSTNKKFVSSSNLKKVESLLSNSSFYRIHRSILLNLKHVKKYKTNGKITLSNNKTVTVSSRNKKGFFKILKLLNFIID
tara:strand:+ start:4480 stop:5235 length:756 start_codon:yes stop_codon:yes gene_type:complete